VRRHRREISAVQKDTTGGRPLESGDQAQQRGLAATRGAEQRKELAFVNIEGQTIDDRDAAETLAQRLNAQQRTRMRIGPRRKISFRSGDRRWLRCEAGISRAF
jgi:hypothetical protein